jgi:eukaryotic-like serine/threonine-protein kinase
VLDALGKAASEIRNKLGESLSTVQKFDTPLEQTTTPSLEALHAYTLGVRTIVRQADEAGAAPLFQRAVNLDPNFAMAYAMLFSSYSAREGRILAFGSIRKAFDLRDRVSEREKFFIESLYHSVATGDLEKEKEIVEVWAMTYPRDPVPWNRLGIIYETCGQYDKSLAGIREALRLSPESGLVYANLVNAYLSLNRFQEAHAAADEAKVKKLDSPSLHVSLYGLAFLQRDAAGMEQQVAWGVGKAGVEDTLLGIQADTAAYSGQLAKARAFSRRAIASADGAKRKQTAAGYEGSAALREALFGNVAEARQHAASALGLLKNLYICGNCGVGVRYGTALALALAGDTSRVPSMADDLGKPFPEDTLIQFNFLPTLQAQLALNRNDAVKAVEILQPAAGYELGDVGATSLYPIFVRGEAYLAAHQGSEAAAEFQKILDHRGIVVNEPIGALAHLQLGRAYAMQGDTAKAKAAYQDFFTLWKDADPDIPILKQAKAEYAKLH